MLATRVGVAAFAATAVHRVSLVPHPPARRDANFARVGLMGTTCDVAVRTEW
jgi:hypothetical protein